MLKTSRAYSKAAFDYALEHQELKSWYTLCQNLQGLSHTAFSNPTLSSEEMRAAFSDLKLTEGQQQWLDLLIEHRHLRLLSEIIPEFIGRYQAHENIVPVKVVTAKPLKAAEQKNIGTRLKKQLNTEIAIDFHTNPALIGGVQFEINDKLIDHSLALVLKQIHTE